MAPKLLNPKRNSPPPPPPPRRFTSSIQHFSHFQEHLCSHQFGVTTTRGYEAVSLGTRALLDIHPDWIILQVDVENAFNNVSRASIFRELREAGGPLSIVISFVWSFY
ncbi:hypothetical protein Mapa_003144 [Marchantia paleacea]|nr:hypothetical protein Mapa_003144 [Marchantia paleacea]